jgi:sporulation protein YlmC with PRC-barrel domain
MDLMIVAMINVDELLGKTVIGEAGYYIGEIIDIDIDPTTWQITHLHVKLSDKAAKEFGLKKMLKSSTIRISTSFVKNIDVIITLNQSLLGLKENRDYIIVEPLKIEKTKKTLRPS